MTMSSLQGQSTPMAADRHTYRITGGVPLSGAITASGAKNSVTKQLVSRPADRRTLCPARSPAHR